MNAIIMAAGTSSRFAPLSYEKPKGLLKVKGDILIERQIRQLKDAGVSQITIVVGYKAEMFEYLKGDFGVDIVMNEDYSRFNNTSSIIRVLDKLENTFICSSDNYFPENVFLEPSSDSYYSALYAEGNTHEYCLYTDAEDNIVQVEAGGSNSWYMVGHAFFNKEFSLQFREIMLKEYEKDETKKGYWEDVFMRYVDQLPKMKIRRYSPHDIEEFDTLEELRVFDTRYVNNTDCRIFRNICNVLHCDEKDICDVEVLKKGMTNSSFCFRCKMDGRKYVYRHPGDGTESFISRESEYFSMKVAKELGLDYTYIYMHPDDGWKISYYIEGAKTLDYHDIDELKKALELLAKLHDANIQSAFPYRLWDQANDFFCKLKEMGKDDAADFYDLHERIESLYKKVQEDGWPECLNHCDALAANFLIDKKTPEGKMALIDWEYSGQGDTAQDLGSFIACSDMSLEEAVSAIGLYLGHTPSIEELRHFIAYVALAAYCWYLWAIYQEANGIDTADFMGMWYDYTYLYSNLAMEYYQIKD